VGSADTSTGQSHASQWILDPADPLSFVQIVDQHPGGSSSVWNDFQNPSAAGTARTANGQSLGFFAAPLQPLTPLQGLRNSSADGIVPTQYGARIIGVSWDNPTQPLAGLWNHIASLNRTRGYPANAVMYCCASQDMGTINLFRAIGNRVIAGSGVDSTLPGRTQPVLLIADGAEMPDVVAVRVGQPAQQFNETVAWRAGDGNTLGIRSANSDGDRAVIEMSFFGGQALSNIQSMIRARAVGDTGSIAQMTVDVFNFGSGAYDPGCEAAVCTPTATTQWATFPASITAANHVDANTGEIRLRFTFNASTKGVRGYEIDAVSVQRN
jgi:hypothetical protein